MSSQPNLPTPLDLEAIRARLAESKGPQFWRSLEEAAGILGISPADIVKSLVVKHKDGTFLFALVPGQVEFGTRRGRRVINVTPAATV